MDFLYFRKGETGAGLAAAGFYSDWITFCVFEPFLTSSNYFCKCYEGFLSWNTLGASLQVFQHLLPSQIIRLQILSRQWMRPKCGCITISILHAGRFEPGHRSFLTVETNMPIEIKIWEFAVTAPRLIRLSSKNDPNRLEFRDRPRKKHCFQHMVCLSWKVYKLTKRKWHRKQRRAWHFFIPNKKRYYAGRHKSQLFQLSHREDIQA